MNHDLSLAFAAESLTANIITDLREERSKSSTDNYEPPASRTDMDLIGGRAG
jgi:hypothetical protein